MFSPPRIYILLVVLLLALGLVFLYVVINKARRSPVSPSGAPPADDEGDDPAREVVLDASSVGLKLSFQRAMRRIRSYGKGFLYKIPWYLVIGEAGSGKTTLLGNTGLELLSNAPDERRTGIKQGLNWFFFAQGIVLDVAGDFVLRADGATSNVAGWNRLVAMLRHYRPERPLDGIILTIPYSDLASAAGRNPGYKFKLEKKAQYLYNKLVDAQKQLGLGLPVYVLVTKCDEVRGFKSLCREIPERRDEMVGWSNPYTREIAYRAEWVTEAFHHLHSYLFELQIEVFAERNRVASVDDFFMLPTEVRAMRAPLQIYLDQIFKESAYHEPFFLRGIYFCGDGAGALPVSTVVLDQTAPQIYPPGLPPGATRAIAASTVTPAAASAPVERQHAFLAHLFERKIFQEVLARPLDRTMLSRNRLVLAAQVLSLAIPVVGALGILATYPALKERETTFYSYLTREEQDLTAIRAEKESGFADERARGRESRLFEAMSNMSGKNLISPFIPGSWFSHVAEQSGASISNAYPFVVYDSLRHLLDCRTESRLVATSLSQGCYADIAPATERSLNKCASDESAAPSNSVSAFIESLNELTQNRARYKRLIRDEGGGIDDLNHLLRYFDHAQLPPDFDVRNALFVQALRTSPRPALRTTDESVSARAACKVEGMIQDIYEQTFKNQNVNYGHLGDITKTELLLSRPENKWLADHVFQQSPTFRGLTIAVGLGELKRALNDLSKEKFMSPGDATPQRPGAEPRLHHQSRSTLVWDKATLQQAVDLYAEYADFVRTKSYNRPDTLDNTVKRVARNDMQRKFLAILSRAPRRALPQVLDGESPRKASLRVEIKSLLDAQDLLANLLDICRSLGIVSLRNTLSIQTSSLLSAVDAEFADGNFYAVNERGFSGWTTKAAFHSYTVFGASNADELEVYLATQRESIAELGRQFAAPVLGFASAQGLSPRGSVNWKAILDQLDKYDAKKPGNTVSVLENFIRFEMDKVKPGNCSAIDTAANLQPLDFFIRKRNALRKAFLAQCRMLEAEEAEVARRLAAEKEQADRERLAAEKEQQAVDFERDLESYTNIERAFNRTLTDKFPFSALPQGESFAEADPESISAFFEVLAKNKDKAQAVLRQAPDYNLSPAEALAFLKQMEEVRVFFDAFLGKKQVSPTFAFNLRFRANEENEIGANQIIDWAFDVGNRRLTYRSIDPAGAWGYGEPLSLSLRWANDSPSIPAANFFPPQSRMKLEGQTVTLTYRNKWSLLFLILRHKATGVDFKGSVDVEPYTLKIEVPTQPNARLSNALQQAQDKSLSLRPAKVFLSISLMAGGKKDAQEPLILPDPFPTFAPQLRARSRVTRPRQVNGSN
jgi:type VI secretion system protein ImpL